MNVNGIQTVLRLSREEKPELDSRFYSCGELWSKLSALNLDLDATNSKGDRPQELSAIHESTFNGFATTNLAQCSQQRLSQLIFSLRE